LSAGANIDKDKEGKPQQVQVVNLLVTPVQAEILSLAGNETRIQLVLRNPLDTAITAPPGTVMSALFGQLSPPSKIPTSLAPVPLVVAVAAPHIDRPAVSSLIETVEVLNGPTRTLARFESSGTSR
jgi:pilus assembly protein CpaB